MMLFSILLRAGLIITLLSACSPTENDAAAVTIKIYTAALGSENDNFPKDIIELWRPLSVNNKKIIPSLELRRVDQDEEIAFNFSQINSLIPPDPDVKLDIEKETLQTKKIDATFSQTKASNFNLVTERLAKYPQEDVFYLKSYFKDKSNYNSSVEVLKALEKRISENADKKQEYVVVYKIIDEEAVAEKAKQELAEKNEIQDLIKQAQTSKQSVEAAVVASSSAVENIKHNAQKMQEVMLEVNQSIAAAECNDVKTKAKTIALKIEGFKKTVETASNDAQKAISSIESHSQKVNSYTQQITQPASDKQTIKNALKTAVAAVTDNKKTAEAALTKANDAATNAEKLQQSLANLPACEVIKEPPVKKIIGIGPGPGISKNSKPLPKPAQNKAEEINLNPRKKEQEVYEPIIKNTYINP